MAQSDPNGDDSVVSALRETQARYEGVREELRAEAASHKAEAERQRQRAERLSEALNAIHRAFYHSNLYDLLLRACLHLTGATRGLYVTVGSQGPPHAVPAAVDVEGYPQSPASPFLESLCTRAVAAGKSIVHNGPEEEADLPHPTQPAENFRNFVAAPVVLTRGLSGVIIVADKEEGGFSEDDAQTLLHVGGQAAIAAENIQLREKLQNAYLATVSVLADAMEAKDPYTHGHCEMVSRYARRIARRMNLNPRDLSIVSYAALLHDIGKIGVSDGILNKPGPLLPEEREVVRSHVRVGHDLIQHVPALTVVADAVLHHHEWFDGSGYPDGLQGEQIPIAARIVCVVDSFGAMITRRSYKEAFGEDYARSELSRCAGTQFDPQIVETFLGILDDPEAAGTEEEEMAELAPLPDFLPQSDQ